MSSWIKIATSMVFTGIIFISASFGFLRWNGIQPNFFLILPLVIFFFADPTSNKKHVIIFLFLCEALIFYLVLFKIWWPELIVIAILLTCIFALKHFFTGNHFVDFILAIAASTALFNIFLSINNFNELS